ncbi:unnamed protein product [Sympodiomycopsis kandeliae]
MRSAETREHLLRAASSPTPPPAARRSSRTSSRPQSRSSPPPSSPLLSSTPTASSSGGRSDSSQLRNKPSLLDARSTYSMDAGPSTSTAADRSLTSSLIHSPSLSADPNTDLDADDGEFALEGFEESMRQSNSIDDFTKVIQDFRQERSKRRSGGGPPSIADKSALGLIHTDTTNHFLTSADGRRKRTSSHAGSDDGGSGIMWRQSLDVDRVMPDDASTYTTKSRRTSWRNSGQGRPSRCTCCCGRDDCEKARRATLEWTDMEQDLRLAAEIGQALLRRNDALTAEATTKENRYAAQRDSLMKRLTKSIRESSQLEKELSQCSLNLEAADSSNRALLAELDQTRRDAKKFEAERAKLTVMESRSEKLNREVEDARQEARTERKKTAMAEARARKANDRATQLANSFNKRLAESEQERQERRETLTAEALETAKERFRNSLISQQSSLGASSSEGDQESMTLMRDLLTQNEALQGQMDQTNALLKAANEELAELRDQQRFGPSATITSNLSRPSMHSRRASSGFSDTYRVPTHGSMPVDASHEEESHSATDIMESEIEDAATPVLADEVVFDSLQQPQGSSRTPSRSSVRSQGSIVEHSISTAPGGNATVDSPSLGGNATRLLSPTLGTSFASQQQGLPMPKARKSDVSIEAGLSSSGRQTPTTEAQRIRAAYSASSDAASEDTAPTTAPSLLAPSNVPHASSKKDARTAQLMTLLDYVQRLFVRLASADVDTLAKRLQRQHLAGDVGHLARVTINGITRDAEGLREHFRRLIEAEAKGQSNKDLTEDAASMSSGNSREKAEKESESLVARKEFFALVKLMRDLLFEIARLRSAVNEVQMTPANAAKILQDHLGAAAQEDTGVSAWLGKWLGGGLGGGSGAAAAAAAAAGSSGGPPASAGPLGGGGSGGGASMASNIGSGQNGPGLLNPGASRPASRAGNPMSNFGNPQVPRAASRAAAAVLPSAIAVEVKGSRASTSNTSSMSSSRVPYTRSADPSGLDDSPIKNGSHGIAHQQQRGAGRGLTEAGLRPNRGRSGSSSLSRVQSRNLSGIFVGAPADGWANAIGSDRPLSRIVDDDEISIHQGKPAWKGGQNDGDSEEEEEVGRPRLRRGLSDSSIHSAFLDHGERDEETTQNDNPSLSPSKQGRPLQHSGIPAGRMMVGNSSSGNASKPSMAPPSRIMTKSSLALQAGGNTSAQPSLQQQRSRGLLAGLGSLAGWGSSSSASSSAVSRQAPTQVTTEVASTQQQAIRPTLRSPASNAALSLAAASAGGNAVPISRKVSSPETVATALNVPSNERLKAEDSNASTPEGSSPSSYSRSPRRPTQGLGLAPPMSRSTSRAGKSRSTSDSPSVLGSGRPGAGMTGRSAF